MQADQDFTTTGAQPYGQVMYDDHHVGQITCAEVAAGQIPFSGPGEKIVHLIRHGEGTHNRKYCSEFLEDGYIS